MNANAHISPVGPRGSSALLYFVLAVSVLVFLDPTYLGIGPFRVNRDVGWVKYIILPLIAFYVIYVYARNSSYRFERALLSGGVVFAYATMVAMGSLYARMVDDVAANYLQLALAAFFGYAFGVALIVGGGVRGAKSFIVALALCSLYALPMVLLKRTEGGQAFHTEAFLLLPPLVYFFFSSRGLRSTISLVTVFTFALALHKNIGYLTLLISFISILYARRSKEVGDRDVAFYSTIFISAASIIGVVIWRVVFGASELLPSGNIEVRTFVYESLLNKFLSSPILGDFYASSVHVDLLYLTVLGNGHVTGHSDWLDSLAHGGVVGFFLLFFSVTMPILGARRLVRSRSREVRFISATFAAIALSGAVAAAFVSMLASLPIAILFWTSLGVLNGLQEYVHD